MNNARLSVLVWSIYLFVIGAGLFAFPNVILSLSGMTASTEPWIRVLGAVIFVLGYQYFRVARSDVSIYYPWTVHARWGFALGAVIQVLLNFAPVNLLMFAVVDFLGGLWTLLALRSGYVTRAATP